jgi:hypothetical protein
MNARKLSDFAKILFITSSILASATMPAHAELLIGISFPSQGGGDNDTFEIDESLLTLPKLHLQDGPAFGPDIRNWSSDPTIKFSTTYTMVRAYYPHQTIAFTNVFPAFSYSLGPAKFYQGGSFTTGLTVREQLPSPLRSVNVGEKGTLQSSAASDSSTSVLATASQPAGGILTVTLKQNTLELDWPADHIGWILQTQTHSRGAPINPQWSAITGSSATNHLQLTLDRANSSVFSRLVAP